MKLRMDNYFTLKKIAVSKKRKNQKRPSLGAAFFCNDLLSSCITLQLDDNDRIGSVFSDVFKYTFLLILDSSTAFQSLLIVHLKCYIL